MNGKSNLFIKCFICLCAYFYSVNAYANTEYIFTSGSWGTVQLGGYGAFRCTSPWKVFNGTYYGSSSINADRNASTDATFKCWQLVPKCIAPQVRDPVTQLCGSTSTPTPAPSQCLAGFKFVEADNTCKPDCSNLAGELNSSWRAVCERDCSPLKGKLLNAAANDQGQICADKCRANVVKIVQQCAPGQSVCLGTWAGQYRYDGTKCNGSEISVPAGDMTENPEQLTEGLKTKLTPYECYKQGKSSGTVNGQTVCTGKLGDEKTNSVETSTESKINPDGSKSSTTTTTTTTEEGGKVTTSSESKTTTTDKDGNTTTASSVQKEEVDKDTYCKKKPNDEKCKAGSVSGACDKAFTCSGDVVACESAKVGWLDFCANEKQKKESSDSLAEFEKSKNVVDGLEIIQGKKEEDIKKELGIDGTDPSKTFELKDLIDTDGWLSGGSLQDRTITVEGKSFEIPFSKMNYWLKMLGDIAVLVTFLACVRIILGGNK